MQELSRRTHARLLTDIAFVATFAALASFSVAVAQAQSGAPSQQGDLARDKPKTPDERKDDDASAPSTGGTRAAPAPQLPADRLRPPVSGAPLDEPGKALHPAPPEKVEGK